LPVVIYGFEALSLTLREEYRLRAFLKRVPRYIFRPKGGEITEEWRRLHIVKFYSLYSLLNINRVISPKE
jgi:hypothetical protein